MVVSRADLVFIRTSPNACFVSRSNSDILVYIQPDDLEHMRRENSLWLGNHRYEVDWLLGWVCTQRLGLAGVSR